VNLVADCTGDSTTWTETFRSGNLRWSANTNTGFAVLLIVWIGLVIGQSLLLGNTDVGRLLTLSLLGLVIGFAAIAYRCRLLRDIANFGTSETVNDSSNSATATTSAHP